MPRPRPAFAASPRAAWALTGAGRDTTHGLAHGDKATRRSTRLDGSPCMVTGIIDCACNAGATTDDCVYIYVRLCELRQMLAGHRSIDRASVFVRPAREINRARLSLLRTCRFISIEPEGPIKGQGPREAPRTCAGRQPDVLSRALSRLHVREKNPGFSHHLLSFILKFKVLSGVVAAM